MYELEYKVAHTAIREAAKIVMSYYAQDIIESRAKADKSPVTNGDIESNQMILSVLRKSFPNDGYLTEETEDNLARLNQSRVWIIDPIDGTKDFIHKTDEFTINIALAVDHQVVLGLVLAPARNQLFYGMLHQGAYLDQGKGPVRIHVNGKTDQLTTLTSRFHQGPKTIDYIKKHSSLIAQEKVVGASLKACYIAMGLYEHAIKIGSGLHEWDIAAPHMVLQEAGGFFIQPHGEPITYNNENAEVPSGYLAMNVYQSELIYHV